MRRDQGWEEGRQKGRKEGRQEGSERGEWIGRILMSQELLGIPLTAKEELASLRIEELQAKARALEQQFRTQKTDSPGGTAMMREWTNEDRERERQQARLKWERDQTAFIEEAQEKGEWIGRILIFQQMLKVPPTPRNELATARIEELKARAKALEQRLGIATE
jgi:hypothetical protein